MKKKQVDKFRIKLINKTMLVKDFCEQNNLEYSLFIQRLHGFKKMDETTETAIKNFMGK